MTIEKQDSNNAGLFVARETTERVLGATPVFHTREPNSFDALGGDYSSVARRVFGPSRQRKKGGIVDLDADGGWNEDLTQNNMLDTLEGFCFAAKRPQPHLTGAISATAATDDFTVGTTAALLAGHLLFVSGFANSANNGLHAVDGITDGTHVSTTSALTDEAAASASVQVVGFQFAAGDCDIAAFGGLARLTSVAIDLTTLDLIPGEWVFVGGQAAGNRFATVTPGYARIKAVTADYIDFDKTTFAIATDAGAGKSLQLFFGTVIKNEDDPDLIVKFTHTVERTLGKDADGRQSEYIDGFVFNELKWTSPLADKVSLDIKGVALGHSTRTGLQGPLCEAAGASIVKQMDEEFFNTSSNVYRLRLAVLDGTLNPTPLFARCTEWSMTTKNNVVVDKAQGTLGGFGSTAGMYDVDMEGTFYFASVASIAAIRANADVTFDAIYSKQNAAVIVDVPLLGMSAGKLNVEMDKAIMLPAKLAAGESEAGHTLLFSFLPYVPNVGMATG